MKILFMNRGRVDLELLHRVLRMKTYRSISRVGLRLIREAIGLL